MNILNGKYVKFVAAGVLAAGIISVPVRAAFLATEKPIAGANVVVEEFCQNVANGTVSQEAVAAEPDPAAAMEVQPDIPEQTAEPEDEHVKLNLNYSRLGIASKVDTYLNVRSKPSEKSKIVGKMTKNAGCHIYKVKKGWAKMVSGKVEGWVKAKYIVTDERAEQLATKVGRECVEINTNSLRVRALPTTSAPIYSIVSEDEEFVIRKKHVTMNLDRKSVV